MTDINLKTLTPDTSLPTTGFLFGADSQATASPSVYSTQTVATTLLGSTSLTGDTLTASAPVLDLAQTWNNGSTTFTGALLNVTNTNSGASSNLVDLQVGGTSQFSVGYNGTRPSLNLKSTTGTVYNITGNGATLLFGYNGGNFGFGIGFGDNSVQMAGALTFSPNTLGPAFGADLFLRRRGSGNFAFGAADAASPVAQTLSVQSVVAGTTDGAGQPFTFTGSQSTGTGVPGNILFQTASSAATTGSAQNALATVATFGPSTLRLAQTTPVLNLAQTWNTSGIATGLKLNVTNTASSAASLLMDLQVGGSSKFNVDKTGALTLTSAITVQSGNSQIAPAVFVTSASPNYMVIPGTAQFGFGAGGAGIDIFLTRKTTRNLQLGEADASTALAQTLSVQSVVAGATNNPAGADFTINGSQGLGSGAGGSIIFKVAPAGAAANPAQNALVAALTINSSKQAAFVSGTSSIPSIIFNGSTTTGIYEPYGNQIGFSMQTTLKYLFGGSAFSLGDNILLRWSNSGAADGTNDVNLSRAAAGVLQVGTTAANASGTIKAAVVGTTTAYTVATLPTGFQGARAYVTDATLPTYLGALTGGGAVVCPVFYNGTAWVSA